MGVSFFNEVVAGFFLARRGALMVWDLLHVPYALLPGVALFVRHSRRQDDVYHILWAVVFGFATLNILSLAARRFEPNRRGLTFGELMAVMVVLLSIFLLGWELLSTFHIFPIHLQRSSSVYLVEPHAFVVKKGVLRYPA